MALNARLARPALVLLSACLLLIAALAAAQDVPTTAEAVGQANLRAAPDVTSDLVGEIRAGARYPVVGRSEFFPWLLLGDPVTGQPIGWVFADLVQTQGSLSAVPFSTLVINATASFATPIISPGAAVGVAVPLEAVSAPLPTPSPSPTLSAAVIGLTQGEVNIRFGPGVDYPRIGVAQAGERYEITGWHTQLPWLQIRFPQAPNGYGWVARDLLTVQGDLFSLPAITQTRFNLPTLTPTPPAVQLSAPPGAAPVPLSPTFADLSDQLWNLVLGSGFDPLTNRFGALFVADLQTGEAFSFGSQYAFSGTSINKIAILARLYAALNAPPEPRLAADIANTMICSENVATNRLLSVIGSGSDYQGAWEVTSFLRQLGLQKTFLTAPFTIPGATPAPPPAPIPLPTTSADQVKANPDPSNQLTVDEMGWLLADIYRCAYQESGPLLEQFNGLYQPRECRQMLHVMSSNTVDALLKAGVPADTRVAHKHGWINDTHGNAAVFFTPGGDYIITMMLHQPEWLNFTESLPLIAEVSRTVYNYFNPTAPMPAIRDGFIPEAPTCNFAGTPLIDDLTAAVFNQ
ncbi:MAG: serine hydrolase [Aggregatilineales bacterium]